MNKATKTALIIIICCVVSIAVGGIMIGIAFNYYQADSGNAKATFNKVTYDTNAAGISKLTVKDNNNTGIRIERSVDSRIHITYWESVEGDIYYDITEQKGELLIKYINKRIFSVNLDVTDRTIVIAIPEGCALSANLRTANGSIDANGAIIQGALLLDTDNGKITAEGVSATDITVTSNNGKVTVNDCKGSGSIELFTDNGAIMAGNTIASGDISIESSNGNITMTDVTAGGKLSAETDNGEIDAKACRAGGDVKLDSSTDRITIDKLQAGGDIDIHTDNGDIEGTILGDRNDYTIESKTHNGDNSLGWGGSGQYKLKITSNNGDILVDFTK